MRRYQAEIVVIIVFLLSIVYLNIFLNLSPFFVVNRVVQDVNSHLFVQRLVLWYLLMHLR